MTRCILPDTFTMMCPLGTFSRSIIRTSKSSIGRLLAHLTGTIQRMISIGLYKGRIEKFLNYWRRMS